MEHLLNTVHHADCFDLLAMIPDGAVDAIITDLPYGTTACSWDTVIPFEPMWAAVKRVLKPRGVFVTTASQPFTSALVMSNPAWFKYEWVWVKSKAFDFLNAKNKPMKRHENVLVFSDGTTANCSDLRMNYHPQNLRSFKRTKYRPSGTVNARVVGNRPSHVNEVIQEMTGYPDSVLEFSNGNNFNEHPTQKPVALYEYLIRTYTQADDVVLDFCCGSGTTAVAARNTGRCFIAGDSSAEYVAIARDRLRMPFEPRQVETKSAPLEDLPLFAIGD